MHYVTRRRHLLARSASATPRRRRRVRGAPSDRRARALVEARFPKRRVRGGGAAELQAAEHQPLRPLQRVVAHERARLVLEHDRGGIERLQTHGVSRRAFGRTRPSSPPTKLSEASATSACTAVSRLAASASTSSSERAGAPDVFFSLSSPHRGRMRPRDALRRGRKMATFTITFTITTAIVADIRRAYPVVAVIRDGDARSPRRIRWRLGEKRTPRFFVRRRRRSCHPSARARRPLAARA